VVRDFLPQFDFTVNEVQAADANRISSIEVYVAKKLVETIRFEDDENAPIDFAPGDFVTGLHPKTETREIETPNIEWRCSREKQKETRASDSEVQGKGCAANDCGGVCVSSEPGAEGKPEAALSLARCISQRRRGWAASDRAARMEPGESAERG
jgi:hypothetical protein